MKKTLLINNHELAYNVKISKRAKNARISIYCDKSVTITIPRYVDISNAEKFLRKKIDWVMKKINRYNNRDTSLPVHRRSKKDYQENKKQALALVKEKISKFQPFYNFNYNKISIRNQKTRWGSCSISKNLNFNYKLIYLPNHLAEYIIVHEICHLSQMNHSKNFWKLVSLTFPEYKKIIKQLREL